MGVRYLVLGKGRSDTAVPSLPGYRRESSFDYIDLLRNEGVYPRFLNPTHAKLLRVDERPEVDAFIDNDFADTFWLTPRDADDHASGVTQVAVCHGKVDVEVREVKHTRQTLRTKATSPGWVVAGELDYPGWTAELDGTPLPVHRANGMFRAVCVPAGAHELRFVFRPWAMVMYAWRHRG